MPTLADFDSLALTLPGYGGSDEKRKGRINGEWWMFKFGAPLEPDPAKPLQASYESSPVSEFIGCHVAESIGLNVQKTLLGSYHGRLVVACRDFVRNDPRDLELYDFAMLENSTEGYSSTNHRTPEYGFTMRVLNEHPFLEPIRERASDAFWKTLVVDALLGNFDRHAHNWGYLAAASDGSAVDVAPIFDLGSSLSPRLAEWEMKRLLEVPEDQVKAMLTYPNVRLLIDGRRPHYHEFLLSREGSPARGALIELLPKIDRAAIGDIIDAVPGISETRRAFYRQTIDLRFDRILKPAYELAQVESRKKTVPVSLTKGEVGTAVLREQAARALESRLDTMRPSEKQGGAPRRHM